MVAPEPDLVSLLVVAGAGAVYLRDRFQQWRVPTDEEAIREAYASGDIDEAELERRLAYVLDGRNEEIVEALTQVTDVGPKTARAVAQEFDSLDAVRAADEEALTAVHGVGPSTAAAIQQRFGK